MRFFKKHKNLFFFVFRLLIAILLLKFLFTKVPFVQIKDSFFQISKPHLLGSLFIFLFMVMTCIYRWRILLVHSGIHLPFGKIAYPYFVGLFLNLVFPSIIAGDLYRAMKVGTEVQDRAKVMASVVADRFSGYIALVLLVCSMFFFSIPFIKIEGKFVWVVFGLLVLLMFGFLYLLFSHRARLKITSFTRRHPKMQGALHNFYETLASFRQSPKLFAKVLGVSLVIQLSGPFIVYWLIKGLGSSAPFMPLAFLVSLINSLAMAPITIAGLGVREWSAKIFLNCIGISSKVAVSINFLVSFMYIAVGLLGGVFYGVALFIRWVQRNKETTSP